MKVPRLRTMTPLSKSQQVLITLLIVIVDVMVPILGKEAVIIVVAVVVM